MAAAVAHSTCLHPAAEGRSIPVAGWEGSSPVAGDRSRRSLAAVGNSAVDRVGVGFDRAGRASHNIPHHGPGRGTV